MIRFFSRYRKPIFISIIILFMAGIFVGLGSYFFASSDVSQAVAEVGGTKLSYLRFVGQTNRILDNMRDKGTEVTDDVRARVKQEVLQEMIIEELLFQQAMKLGLQVTDLELASEIHHTPAFQRSGAFNQGAYIEAIRYLFSMNPSQYEEMRRRSLAALKLRQFVFLAAKLTPAEVAAEYARRHEGKVKDFEKDKDSFSNSMQQERMLHLLNFYLRQLSSQVEIRSFLELREKGQ